MSFSAVEDFEVALAAWWGAPYAVATDCCTHAIELCLRMCAPSGLVKVPKHTYLSVPMTLEKIRLPWEFTEEEWSEHYTIANTNIVDSAVYWKEGGYLSGTLQCLSFQFKKPLNLGRGGAILCEDYDDYVKLKKMAYDGRFGDAPWAEQAVNTMGYHYYMTPETAQMGIEKLPDAHLRHTKTWSWQDYPDLSLMPVFAHKRFLYYV
jgi:dTDP-4-amino-4,6-dideoxygalactose transaminase